MMSECMKKEINHFNENGFTILFTGNSIDNDEYIVAENGGLAVVVRNQGDHDRKFFLVKMCNPSKALEIAKRHCI